MVGVKELFKGDRKKEIETKIIPPEPVWIF